jgi:hypothetical protein
MTTVRTAALRNEPETINEGSREGTKNTRQIK